jgi:RNA polymerase sigma-70 factor (ECF subfamily)
MGMPTNPPSPPAADDPQRSGRTKSACGAALTAAEFAAQFRASFRVMWLVAVGIVGDSDIAEDVVQESAIVALRKLGQFERGTSFRAWAGRIVRNVALNALRSERRRHMVLNRQPAEAPASNAPGSHRHDPLQALPLAEYAVSELDGRVVAALEGLGDIARACLVLRTVGDLQYSEIASLLDIPEGTAMSHVHRSRHQLRQRLAGVWAEHTGDQGKGVGPA